MPLYNFEVKQTISFFIQRDCEDDNDAIEKAKDLESEGYVDPNEKMPDTDFESDFDLEVVRHGKNEGEE